MKAQEKVKHLGSCPICGKAGILPKDKKAQAQGYRLCVNPSCNNSVYQVKSKGG